MKIRIKTNSLRAKYAARIMKTDSIAIVFGSTICLWNCSREDFLKNISWVRHETAHVHQFKKYGFIQFYFLYLIEHFKHGYTKNKYEIDARQKESDINILSNVTFV